MLRYLLIGFYSQFFIYYHLIQKITIFSFDEINRNFFLGARITRGKICPTRPTAPETRSPRTLDDPGYPVFILTPLGRKVTAQNVRLDADFEFTLLIFPL